MITRNPLRWLLCIVLLIFALFLAAQVRAEVYQDSLPRSGGEMHGTIKRVYAPGEDASIVQLYSGDASLLASGNLTSNETLRVLRIWNDHGIPRIDLRKQGQSNLTVRVSSDRIEMPIMVMVPQATPPPPVVGGMYVSTSGAIYICASLATGWQLLF